MRDRFWIGLDVGTKTIGVARAHVGLNHCRPWFTVSREGLKKDIPRLCARVAQEGDVEGWVVGLPFELDGSEARSARLARQVGEALAALGLPVYYQDERFSSLEAERRLHEQGVNTRRQRDVIDQAAAAVILEDWLRKTAGGTMEIPG